MDNKFTFSIKIAEGKERVPLLGMTKLLDHVRLFMESARSDVIHDGEKLNLQAHDFKNSSFLAKLESSTQFDQADIDQLEETTREIIDFRNDHPYSQKLSKNTLQRFIKLAEQLGEAETLKIGIGGKYGWQTITRQQADNIRPLLKDHIGYVGGIVATIEKINLADRLISVRDFQTGYLISECKFEHKHYKVIHAATEDEANPMLLQIAGEIEADTYTHRIQKIRIQRIRACPVSEDEDLIEKLQGSQPEITNGQSTQEYMDEIRQRHA